MTQVIPKPDQISLKHRQCTCSVNYMRKEHIEKTTRFIEEKNTNSIHER